MPLQQSSEAAFAKIADDITATLYRLGKPQTLSDLWDAMGDQHSVDQLRRSLENLERAGRVLSSKDVRNRTFFRLPDMAAPPASTGGITPTATLATRVHKAAAHIEQLGDARQAAREAVADSTVARKSLKALQRSVTGKSMAPQRVGQSAPPKRVGRKPSLTLQELCDWVASQDEVAPVELVGQFPQIGKSALYRTIAIGVESGALLRTGQTNKTRYSVPGSTAGADPETPLATRVAAAVAAPNAIGLEERLTRIEGYLQRIDHFFLTVATRPFLASPQAKALTGDTP